MQIAFKVADFRMNKKSLAIVTRWEGGKKILWPSSPDGKGGRMIKLCEPSAHPVPRERGIKPP